MKVPIKRVRVHGTGPYAPHPELEHLCVAHFEELRACSPEWITARDVCTAYSMKQLKRLLGGRLWRQLRGRVVCDTSHPALVFFWRDERRKLNGITVKLHPQRQLMSESGVPRKYEIAAGSEQPVDLSVNAHLLHTSAPITFTEGWKKGRAVASRTNAFAVVSLNSTNGIYRTVGVEGTKRKRHELVPALRRISFYGRKVTLLFDRDILYNPSVAMLAYRGRAVLRRRHARVQIVCPPREKGVDDFLLAGGKLDEVLANVVPEERLLELTTLARRKEKTGVGDAVLSAVSARRASNLAMIGVSGEPEAPPVQQDAIERLLPFGMTTVLAGAGGSGKSFTTLEMALALTTGRSYCELAVPRPMPALIVAGEDRRAQYHARLASIVDVMHGGRLDERDAKRWRRNFALVDLYGHAGGWFGAELSLALRRAMDQFSERGVLVIDPLLRFLPSSPTGGNALNTQEGALLVHRFCDGIANATGWAVLLVHHFRKRGFGKNRQDAGLDDVSGSHFLVDLARRVLLLDALTKKRGEALGLPEDEWPSMFELWLEKTNGPPLGRRLLFQRGPEGVPIFREAIARADERRIDAILVALADAARASKSGWLSTQERDRIIEASLGKSRSTAASYVRALRAGDLLLRRPARSNSRADEWALEDKALHRVERVRAERAKAAALASKFQHMGSEESEIRRSRGFAKRREGASS